MDFPLIEKPDMEECDIRPTVNRLENWLIWGDPEGFKDFNRKPKENDRTNNDNR